MRIIPKAIAGTLAVTLLAGIVARAEKPDKDTITEKDKKVYQNLVAGLKNELELRKNKALQVTAVNNLRQIGLALFEFETEYGEVPNDKTAEMVSKATATKANLKSTTANDCFYQIIEAGIVERSSIFTFADPNPKEKADAKKMGHLEKCDYSLLDVKSFAGNPSKPLVVAPLVKGKETFDRVALGGRAVVLRLDNSVGSYPIDAEGRVMVNGKDLFDPEQPFWQGDVPQIRWPND